MKESQGSQWYISALILHQCENRGSVDSSATTGYSILPCTPSDFRKQQGHLAEASPENGIVEKDGVQANAQQACQNSISESQNRRRECIASLVTVHVETDWLRNSLESSLVYLWGSHATTRAHAHSILCEVLF
ncbi:hypothetical protein VNO77_34066 [Canavalia gladiata]|uniref:Uncharacterized protein n=1 Tax=Canavalia gladiata TaxID=3824 RepID=A0AAN9PY89_CANGL